jgi:hypothetical protein
VVSLTIAGWRSRSRPRLADPGRKNDRDRVFNKTGKHAELSRGTRRAPGR